MGQKDDEGRRHDGGAERETLQEKSEGGWKRERKEKREACGWKLGQLFQKHLNFESQALPFRLS